MSGHSHKIPTKKNPSANEGRRYRAYPTPDTDARMMAWGHTRRALRNLALEQRQLAWEICHKGLNFAAQYKDVAAVRAECDWVEDFPAQAAQQVLLQLDQAYKNWWNPDHPAGAPAFEKRSGTLRFSLPGQAVEVRKISKHWAEARVPKVGWVRFRLSRPLGGLICNATFTKSGGAWHVAFGVAVARQAAPPNGRPLCGADFGVACSAYVSDEDAPRLMPPSLTAGEQRRLLGLERRKARQITSAKRHNGGRYSKRLRRTIAQIARLKAKQARRRLDFTHKLTTDLAKNHGFVGIEDLHVMSMTASAKGTVEAPGSNVAQKAGLNRGILDNIPGERRRQLAYKAPWYGSALVVVPAPFTSQTCAECHKPDPQSRPGCGRAFACVHCGHQDHADHNASMVVAQRAELSIAGGQPVNSAGRRKPSPCRKARGASANHPARRAA